jgi:hypothetical protein
MEPMRTGGYHPCPSIAFSFNRVTPTGVGNPNGCHEFHQVFIRFDQNGLVSPLEKMSGSLMFCVEVIRIGAVYMAHYLRQIPLWRLQQQVIMIGHEAVSMDIGLIPGI